MTLILYVSFLLASLIASVAGLDSYSFALDLGNEWLKVCLVSPQPSSIGSYTDIAINEQSNRKTPSMVGFNTEGDRLIGEDALNQFYKTPNKIISHIPFLASTKTNKEVQQVWNNRFSHFNYKSTFDLEGINFEFTGESKISSQALLATLFNYAQKLAELHLKSSKSIVAEIKDVSLIIPSHFTQAEKKLFIQIANLAGLNVIHLVDTLTAAAIDYGLRNINENSNTKHQNIIIWGGGATYTEANLYSISFKQEKEKDKDSTLIVQLEASYSNRFIGGFDIDLRVQDKLIQIFDKQNEKLLKGGSIKNSPRALAKLLREAREIKEQLTVSPQAFIELNELYLDQNFQVTVKKEEFDAWINDLIPKFIKPLEQAIEEANRKGLKLDGIELYGGGLRSRSIISEAEKNLKISIGRHIDGEEGALLGAATLLAAANKQASHKLTQIKLEPQFSPLPGNDLDVLSDSELIELKALLNKMDSAANEKVRANGLKNEFESFIFKATELAQAQKSKGDKIKLQKLQDTILSSSTGLEELTSSSTFDEINSLYTSLLTAYNEYEASLPKENKKVDEEKSSPSPRRPKVNRKEQMKKAQAKEKAKAQPKPSKPSKAPQQQAGAGKPQPKKKQEL